jgi:hypothetical protein
MATNPKNRKGTTKMTDLFVIGGFIFAWIALQMWILPRFGVQT